MDDSTDQSEGIPYAMTPDDFDGGAGALDREERGQHRAEHTSRIPDERDPVRGAQFRQPGKRNANNSPL
jgi:hypothetical protein